MSASDNDAETSGPIRIVLANLRGVWEELLAHVIEGEADMRLVGRVDGQVEIMAAAGNAVDVLILGAARACPAPGICSHLLSEYPDLKILVMVTAGDQATLYWRGLRRGSLHPTSAANVRASIRRAHALNPGV